MSSSTPTKGTNRPFLGSRDRETSVVLWDVDGGEPVVGSLDRGEPLLTQERWQAALERAEQPLHAPPALRAVARDGLDAELLERPTHLGQAGLVYRLAGLGGVEVVAASVGVEGRKQSMRRNGLLETDEARGGTLLLDQDSREHRACGVVQGHDKVEFRPLRQPGVLRAVLE
jgi:hypothetical protein